MCNSMLMNVPRISLGCLLVLVFAVAQVQADLITPASVAATSSFGGFNPPSLLIDGSGLDGIGDVKDQLHDNVEANNWQTDVFGPPPTSNVDLEFTLDDQYNLSSAYIWNFNNIAGGPLATNFRGIKEFDMFVSTGLDPAPYSLVGNFSLAKAPDIPPDMSNPVGAQTIAIAENNIRRIKFEIIKNFSEDVAVVIPDFDDFVVGLSEVRFEGSLVPEPTTSVLALAALCLAMSRRRAFLAGRTAARESETSLLWNQTRRGGGRSKNVPLSRVWDPRSDSTREQ
jgi:hypothetical protein